jgi:predicted nucleic-acid-binding Zn-ribbon protein
MKTYNKDDNCIKCGNHDFNLKHLSAMEAIPIDESNEMYFELFNKQNPTYFYETKEQYLGFNIKPIKPTLDMIQIYCKKCQFHTYALTIDKEVK